MSLDLLSKIDLVLEWLYLHSGENPTFNAINKGITNYAIEEGEVDDCLKKLHKDGFLYFMAQNGLVVDYYHRAHNFLISFDGKYFWETTKGYRENTIRLNANVEAMDALRERTERNEGLIVSWTRNLAERTADLTFWTRLVAIGAIGLVVWEVIAFFLKPTH